MTPLRAAASALLVFLVYIVALETTHRAVKSPFCSPPKDLKGERFYGQTDGGLPFDRIVYERYFNGSCYGTFVDVGANDGLTFSQTKFLEDRLGWRGLCIEPQPDVFYKLSANRPLCSNLQLGISDEEKRLTFVLVHGEEDNMLSGFKDYMDQEHLRRIAGKTKTEIGVSVLRLDRVLEAAGMRHVDLLSIDTEGNELNVLRSLLGSGVTMEVLMIETNYQKAREAAIRAFMGAYWPRCREEAPIAWNLMFRCTPLEKDVSTPCCCPPGYEWNGQFCAPVTSPPN